MSNNKTVSGLTPNQRITLEAVCDTLLPEFTTENDRHGLFATGARSTGTADRVERLIGSIRDPQDRARVRLLLSVLGSSVANLALAGRFGAFSALDWEAREAVLRSWAHSRLPLRRAGFQALKRLAHVAYLAWPTHEGTHPAWSTIGYPGALPQPADGVAPLATLEVGRDTTLECDVVVVGSGAGGGVAAGVLAAAGRDVIVLERGPNPGSRDLTQIEGDMLGALYLDGGLLMTKSGSMPILAGSCVGGGTTINYTTSFPLPEATREEWDRLSGLSLFGSARFQESLDRVAVKSNVGTQWTTPGRRDALLEDGCRTLGWHVDAMPRNVTDCIEGLECGYCGYGCRHGAKNSTARTYLSEAIARGSRLVAHCNVERVVTEAGGASGVTATVQDARGQTHRLTVRARAVIVAAGAIYTPAVLKRSGLENPRIGRGLRLHPATAVMGIYPDRVEPWSGSLQTRYSDQFADLDGGYGVKFETAPAHFALVGSAFGWESARQFREDVGRLGHTSLVGVLLRDRDAGRVAVGRDGVPRVHYELSRYDVAHLRHAFHSAADVLAASGASEIFTLHTPPVRVRTDSPNWRDRFVAATNALGYRRCRMSYISFHQMASAAMGSDRRRSVVNEMGETHEVKHLFVADGSVFPTSSGVNPMITIMAVADHIARSIAERG